MTLRFFNGLQIEVPDGWADLSTVILAPKKEVAEGQKPSINLVVKRRPAKSRDVQQTMKEYLAFMRQTFGALDRVETKEMMLGSVRAQAVKFTAAAGEKKFRQTTMLYHSGGDEISATVTQLDGDPTPQREIDTLLKSIKPAASGVFGIR